jgi:hypothetical protein
VAGQRPTNREGFIGRHVSRRPGIEIQSNRVGAGRHSSFGIHDASDSADFYPKDRFHFAGKKEAQDLQQRRLNQRLESGARLSARSVG